MAKEHGRKLIVSNRRARHDYEILDTYEAGIVLTGTEVKSLRAGRASLADAFASVDGGEVWLRGVHIPEYSQGSWTNHEPRRNRKLLLHRKEIDRLERSTSESGLTLIPLSLYFSDGKAKIELALARGR
ncbi:MAG TPA: SsrA-binding protein SmpB, partial [Pseudonocardiaceae bacterium]|nr:SsrA-binding protein SmpB [Pseudonocardiaceae bacterium]